MGRGLRIVAVVGALAVLAGACSKKPSTQGGGGSSSPTATKANFLACMVTDTGGIDDRSFNATAWKGMQDAQTQLGVTSKYLQSTSQNDYAPNISAFVGQKCNIIVTV